MNLNELRIVQKSDGQTTWQQAKHIKLYSGSPESRDSPLTDLAS